ncbi:MAG: peptidoglycan D,D-transpeptidase FtsI family protein [Thiobacillaceae bacterium]
MNYSNRRLLKLHLASWRMALVAGLILFWFAALVARAVYLQGLNKNFLRGKGDEVSDRVLSIPAHRGMVVDRYGKPLAISTPVEALWARPEEAAEIDAHQLAELARILDIPASVLNARFRVESQGEVAVDRVLTPEQATRVTALGLPGLNLHREFRRFYPEGEVTAHVVGFTNVDEVGRDGVELAYDDWLSGKPGSRRVLKDRRGRIVADIGPKLSAQMGGNLALSLDLTLQYLAHRELSTAVVSNKARGGGIVVLDAKTGEILALSNLPVYNPNNRSSYDAAQARNRVVTDTFDPGSTMKPFTIAAALERNLVKPDTLLQLQKDYRVGGKLIRDDHFYPSLTVTEILQKSSNIGAVKIAMRLTPEQFWDTLNRAGFGQVPGSGFPGETSGRLRDPKVWKPVEQATMAYGNGISVSLLQLARAYMAFANDGVVMPLTFLKREVDDVEGERVLSVEIARTVRSMMETVTQEGGTAVLARIPGYRVAGKTGTAHKLVDGHYSPDHYISSFVGMAPASDPRLIIAVMIDQPSGSAYYGGIVAAPVFAQVMAAALRQLGIPPDAPEPAPTRMTEPSAPIRPDPA